MKDITLSHFYFIFSTNLKKKAYGTDNDSLCGSGFRRFTERGYYYVDKTDFIPELEDYNAPVFLRPSAAFRQEFAYLYLGVLPHRTKADRFEELFGRIWIGEHPTEEHNRYMVVRYDFSKMVMADDMEVDLNGISMT